MTAIDIMLVFVGLISSYFFRYGKAFLEIDLSHWLGTTALVLITYIFFYFIFGIHKGLWKYISSKELSLLGLMVGASATTLIVIDPLVGLRGEIILHVLTAVLAFFLMANVRFLYRWIRYSNHSSDKEKHRALIVGAGNGGYILLKELSQNPKYNTVVTGFIDDKRAGHIVSGKKVLGQTKDIPHLVKVYNINVIYIAIPSATKNEIARIHSLCQTTKCKIKIMKETVNLSNKNSGNQSVGARNVSIEDLLGRGQVKLNQEELWSYIQNQVVIVTGAGGSIGSELCRQIIKFKPKKVVMIDINENGLYMLEQEFNTLRNEKSIDANIEVISYIASIREKDAIDDIMKKEKPNLVYHAAAHKHVPLMETRPMEAIKNNVFGTNNVIQCCIENKVDRFIMISTDKAVNPTNVMGATKRMTELLLQANGNNGHTKMSAVRFGNVLGSNGSVIPIFKKQIEKGGPITLTDKKITRYFMTIPEAAQLVLQAGFYSDKGEIFVLDMGEPVKIIDLAEKLIQLSGYTPYEEIDIVEIGLRPGEKMYEELRLENEVTSKTKNDLIFVNHVIGVTIDEVNDKLTKLHLAIDEKSDNLTLKNLLLEIIE